MDDKQAVQLKKALYAQCTEYVNKRIENAQLAMDEAQQSANSETKSTAGDKHDTARAMQQLAAEQNAKHLAEALKLKQALLQINPENECSRVESGSLVLASNGNFYVSISAGKIEIEKVIYFAISPGSPLAQRLLGLKVGDETTFNGNAIAIKSIY